MLADIFGIFLIFPEGEGKISLNELNQHEIENVSLFEYDFELGKMGPESNLFHIIKSFAL